MLEFRYDTQLLIEGENLDEDKINEYFTNNFKGGFIMEEKKNLGKSGRENPSGRYVFEMHREY